MPRAIISNCFLARCFLKLFEQQQKIQLVAASVAAFIFSSGENESGGLEVPWVGGGAA